MIEIEALNESIRQVAEGLKSERTKAEALARENAALKQARAQEAGAAREAIAKLRAQIEQHRKQTVAYYQRAQALAALVRQERGELDRARAAIEENARKQALDQNTLQSGLKHADQVARAKERELAQLATRLETAEKNLADLRLSSRERETSLRMQVEEREFQRRALTEEIERLKDSYLRSQADASRAEGVTDELARVRQAAARESQRAQAAETRVREQEQAIQALREKLVQAQQTDSTSEIFEREKQMLLSCLRSTEDKLARAETQLLDRQRMARLAPPAFDHARAAVAEWETSTPSGPAASRSGAYQDTHEASDILDGWNELGAAPLVGYPIDN